MMIILRRRRSSFALQLGGGLLLAAIAVGFATVSDGRSGGVIASAVAAVGFALAALVQGWELKKGPFAVVATDEFLGFVSPQRRRCYVHWNDVRKASHRTSIRGMRWRLETPSGTVSFADPGIDPDRWGLLWQTVVTQVSERGGGVTVDALSNALYD